MPPGQFRSGRRCWYHHRSTSCHAPGGTRRFLWTLAQSASQSPRTRQGIPVRRRSCGLGDPAQSDRFGVTLTRLNAHPAAALNRHSNQGTTSLRPRRATKNWAATGAVVSFYGANKGFDKPRCKRTFLVSRLSASARMNWTCAPENCVSKASRSRSRNSLSGFSSCCSKILGRSLRVRNYADGSDRPTHWSTSITV